MKINESTVNTFYDQLLDHQQELLKEIKNNPSDLDLEKFNQRNILMISNILASLLKFKTAMKPVEKKQKGGF